MTQQKRESSFKETEEHGDDIFNLSRDAKSYLAGFLACAQAMNQREEHTNDKARQDETANQ